MSTTDTTTVFGPNFGFEQNPATTDDHVEEFWGCVSTDWVTGYVDENEEGGFVETGDVYVLGEYNPDIPEFNRPNRRPSEYWTGLSTSSTGYGDKRAVPDLGVFTGDGVEVPDDEIRAVLDTAMTELHAEYDRLDNERIIENLLDSAREAAEEVSAVEADLEEARRAERDAVREAYTAGATAYRIAAETGRSQTAIGKWVADLK
ncbi:hypothetical protein [Corynebacterium nuruki]|uniref:hypothetical protein n=1 Tax=Corynebacterium nuruki TaxID=1032851 RepID=UPI0039BF48B0